MKGKRKEIVILGAGLSGVSAKYFLGRRGGAVTLYEKELRPGGLCRTNRAGGYSFDYCGHLLHFKDAAVSSLVKNKLSGNIRRHKRNAWIYSFGRFTRYPFQANLYGLPPKLIKNCLVDFIKTRPKFSRQKPSNFLDWCYRNFGRSITDNFMLPYNKKFWKISPAELSCDWIDRKIVVPGFRQVISGTIEESRRNLGYNSFFWYPKKGGIEELVKAFSPGRKNLFLRHRAKGIDLKQRKIKFANGKEKKYDFLISTIPLPELCRISKGLPDRLRRKAKKLKWVSIYNLNLGVKGRLRPGCHWVYFPEPEYSFFRVGFSHNFSSLAAAGKSLLYTEVSYSQKYPLPAGINKRVKTDLVKAGIVGSISDIEKEMAKDIKYAYVLYDSNWKACRRELVGYFKKNNIFSLGRFGGWRYISMEEVIKEAKAAAAYFNSL